MRSGELARLAGVSTDTLRHYERKGVLAAPVRASNGYRQYPPQALERVRLIRRALGLGFTLDELARILKARDRGVAPCREVRALAAAKLAETETRLIEITALRDYLLVISKDWDTRLAQAAAVGERAGLLEALVASDAQERKSRSPLIPQRFKTRKSERKAIK